MTIFEINKEIQRGEMVLQKGYIQEALLIFDSILEKDPGNNFALNDKGVALNQLKQYDQAIQIFQQLVDKNTINPTVVFNLISNYLQTEQWEEAERILKEYGHILTPGDVEMIKQDLLIRRSSRNPSESFTLSASLFSQLQEKASNILSKKLFFILGVPKSGTTWVQYLLDGHPELWCSGEGDLNMLLGLSHHMIEEYNKHVVNKNRHVGTTNFTLFNKQDIHYMVITAFALLMSNGNGSSRVNCIGMKHPGLTKSIHIFGHLFPQAKFIHVIREGRDVLVSAWFNNLRRDEEATKRQWPTFKDFVDYGVKEWVTEVEKVRSFGQSISDRYLELRYEALHNDPIITIQQTLEFLGVDASESTVKLCNKAGSFETLSHGRQRGQEDNSAFFRKGIMGDWKNYFDHEATDLFMQHGGKLLEELGYL